MTNDTKMAEDDKKTIAAIKKEGVAMLKALAFMLIGGVMLVGAAVLWFEPLMDGKKPNFVLIWILAIFGAIIEVIGDWKYMDVMEQTKKRVAAQKAGK